MAKKTKYRRAARGRAGDKYRIGSKWSQSAVNYSRAGMNVAKTAAVALAVARGVKSLINVERKVKYTTQTGVSVNTTPVFQCLTNIATGTSDTTRIGNSIKANSLNWRFHLAKTNSQQCIVRIIIFMDIAGHGGTPSESDLLQTTGEVNSPLNLDNGKRFTVLKDFYGQMSNGSRTIFLRKGGMKLNHHCEYDGTSSNVSDTTNGHLWVMYMSNIAPAGDDPTIESYFTFRYIDN